MLLMCGVAVVTGKVPGNVDRVAGRGAEDEFVLGRELNAFKPLLVDSPDVTEWYDPGASVSKGNLDSLRKDTSGIDESIGAFDH